MNRGRGPTKPVPTSCWPGRTGRRADHGVERVTGIEPAWHGGRIAWPRCAAMSSGFFAETASVRAVDRDGDGEGGTDLPHARVGQPSEPFDEDCDGDAIDRVPVNCAAAGYRVLAGLEADSLTSPLIVVVHGATSARRCRGIRAPRETTTTGRRPMLAQFRTTRPHRAQAAESGTRCAWCRRPPGRTHS